MHRITDVDTETLQAWCEVCGPTNVKRGTRLASGRYSYVCKTAHAKTKNHYKTAVPGMDRTKRAEVLSEAGACAICGGTNKLVPDHNHATNTFRGVLCALCNSGLGFFKDSPQLLRNALSYLERDQ